MRMRICLASIVAVSALNHVEIAFALPQEGEKTPQRDGDRSRFQDRGGQQGRRGGQQRSGNDPFTRSPQMAEGNTIRGWDTLQVHTTDGTKVNVSELVPPEGRLVVVNGCMTCPKFLISYSGVEAIAKDYAEDPNTKFIFLYKTLAHPENNGFVQAFALEERLAQARTAKTRLKNTIPFYVDGMDNSALQAFGNSPNSEVVIDSNGKILHCKGWCDGAVLRSAMKKIAGPTETTTRAEDLGLPSFRGVSRSSGKAAPRVRPTEPLSALRIEPANSTEPYFVKLRAEAGRGVLSNSAGKSEIYLGFHLDPVHDVHWNNLVDPVTYTISAPEGVTVTPATGTGPKVSAPTDTDPREFLGSVDGWNDQGPLTVKVVYYACSDGNGDDAKAFCRKIEQTYVVHRERDRNAGTVQSRSRGPGGRGGGRGNMGQGQNGADRMMRMDTNGDGKISAEEAKGTPMERRFDMMDRNGDGELDNAELEQMRQRLRNRGGSGGDRGNGRNRRGGERPPQRPSPPL